MNEKATEEGPTLFDIVLRWAVGMYPERVSGWKGRLIVVFNVSSATGVAALDRLSSCPDSTSGMAATIISGEDCLIFVRPATVEMALGLDGGFRHPRTPIAAADPEFFNKIQSVINEYYARGRRDE